MSVLSVMLKNHTVVYIPYQSATNLFKLLSTNEQTRVRSSCQGKGTCGLCLVRVEQGEVSALTHYEQEHLNARQLEQGVRLACQVQVTGDVSVSLINPLLIQALDNLPIHKPLPNARYAVAIDLGSTQIRISLWDKVNQQRVATHCCFNPQAYYGTDILSRLSAAIQDDVAKQMMSQLVLSIIYRVLMEWRKNTDFQIEQILIVGNTAMLALLAKKQCERLLQPDYWMQAIDCQLEIEKLHDLPIAVVPPLAGFVGSDLLAGVLATRLTEQTDTALFIDFGTNSEIALWHNGKLWVTSVPGGPAFEGCGISCGVAAEIGAISSIRYDNNTQTFQGKLIGESDDIKGLCGSALCDVMACLLSTGQLRQNGRFLGFVNALEIELSNLNYSFILKKRDIDIFQRAKAATGSGITELMKIAKVSVHDLTRLCIGGAFGQFLNIAHAQTIGLLPNCPFECVELSGNTALLGCELLLSYETGLQQLNELKQQANIVNMSKIVSYEETFVDNLFLRPINF